MIKRLLPLLVVLSGPAVASQAQVTVIHGSNEPEVFTVQLNGKSQDLDLRESHRYHAAFVDPATKREICRDGEYKTGLVLKLRSLPIEGDLQPVEVVGMVSSLESIKDGVAIKCGTNQEVALSNKSLSDTIRLAPNKTKPMVVDGKWTILIRMQR